MDKELEEFTLKLLLNLILIDKGAIKKEEFKF